MRELITETIREAKQIKSFDDAITFVKRKLSNPLILLPAMAIGLVFLGLFVWLIDLAERKRNASLNPRGVETRQSSSSTPDTAQAVDRFREKIMNIEDAEKLFTGMEPGATKGVIRIQVSNFWFQFKPYQKRQMVQMITNAWRAEAGTDIVIVHIYDFTGREIAGTKALGGVWTEDE